MELWTIGAFARAARLSPKALRLYDDLGLLPPAAVDGETGYRYYDPDQLDTARMIARLRRLGMPLARVRRVVDLAPQAAATEIEAYWAEVVAETAKRERLATFLVDYLSRRATTVQHADAVHDEFSTSESTGARGSRVATMAAGQRLVLRCAARTDAGLVRSVNADAAYAGPRLLAVADGAGGSGQLASAAAIAAVQPLQELLIPDDELLDALAEAANEAERAIHDIARNAADGQGEAVTTLTALLWSPPHFGVLHIGDTRAYLLRAADLVQITHDHTYVQSLVDEGRISAEEATAHPQRSLLVRAMTGSAGYQPDLSLHEALPGDRYLLCSDGLTPAVPSEAIRGTLAREIGPQEAVDELIALAHRAGAPDNVACVVADVVSA